jgi:hypothetical protein
LIYIKFHVSNFAMVTRQSFCRCKRAGEIVTGDVLMAINLVSLIMEFLTPEMVGRFASALGLDRTATQSAINAAVPSLLAGFSNVARQPGGAQRLANAAIQQADVLDGFSGMLGMGKQSSLIESGSQMLSSLMGNEDQNTLGRALGRFVGIGQGGSGSLLGMLAPAVLGVITRQLGARVDPNGIADLLARQKENIAAALPAGLATEFAGTGFLDAIGGTARTAAAGGREMLGSSASAARAPASDTARGFEGASAQRSWLYWVIPAAVAAAVLIFLIAKPDEQVAQQTAATGQQLQTGGQATRTASLDVEKQVTETISGLRTTLAGITDAASARAAVPQLKEAVAQVDRVKDLSGQLSAEQRKAVTSLVNPTMPTLNQLFDKVLAVPGASEELKPTVEVLKAKLAALAA